MHVTDWLCACESFFMCMRLNVDMHVSHWLCICTLMLMCARVKCCVHVTQCSSALESMVYLVKYPELIVTCIDLSAHDPLATCMKVSRVTH